MVNTPACIKNLRSYWLGQWNKLVVPNRADEKAIDNCH